MMRLATILAVCSAAAGELRSSRQATIKFEIGDEDRILSPRLPEGRRIAGMLLRVRLWHGVG